ncbi:glycine-rich domain-containing protein [Granulicella paludicola]|uniref:glycine-rich domain-containing protein n=1 Tax=Granulicella paludicola TaxID=474951 RepID=UPI0021E03E87|nr:hypothetical protein [Granulicella paludicola]
MTLKRIAVLTFLTALPLSAQGDHANYLTFVVSGAWTVPAGVTQMTIEAWGGGGGGSRLGGGQGGGYFRVTIPMPAAAPGVIRQINYTIGQGGAGGAAGGSPGTSTSVSYNNTLFQFAAHGGAGNNGPVNDNYAGTFDALTTAQLALGTYSVTGANGQFGSSARILSATPAPTAGTIYVSGRGGDGGEAGHAAHTHGSGGAEFFIANPTAFSQNAGTKLQQTPATSGVMPGGGGGGSADFAPPIPAGGTGGANGGQGMIVFSWN